MSDLPLPIASEETVSNLSFWTVDDQRVLEQSCIAVAGLGGAGGMVVQLLGRLGVRNWRLADPDISEVSNIGRQAGAIYGSVGLSKVDIATGMLADVNCHATVTSFPGGVWPENVDDFLDGADIVLEAIAFEAAWLSVLLGRRARVRGLPMVTSIEVGDGCQYTAFRPNPSSYEETVEAYFGVEIDEPATPDMRIDVEAMLSYMPPSFPRGLLQAVADGKVRTPAHSIGVARNASAVGRVLRELLLRPEGPHPFWYPSLAIDEPDPRVGTFIVQHCDRERLFKRSLHVVESKVGPRQFTPIDEYEIGGS